MIDVLNLQRKIKLNTNEIRIYIARLTSAVEEANERTFSIAFISDKRMTELNKFFRGKDSTTDVLSFPHEVDVFEGKSDGFSHSDSGTSEGVTPNFLGDIVISAEQAERQAKENKLSLENEIEQLILHGLLHLCGYDHETDSGQMNRRELDLRKKLKI
jgi:probable rRNA maturation factor